MEFTNIITEKFTKETGLMICEMDKEYIFLLLEKSIMEIGKKIINKE